MSKRTPWDRVNIGDTIYFKDSGDPITVKAEVTKVIQIENLSHEKADMIIKDIWKEDVVDEAKIPHLKGYAKDKKYCILIYLKNSTPVTPFYIDKTGYGAQAAWITIENIEDLKINL